MAFIAVFTETAKRISLAVAIMTTFIVGATATANADVGTFLKSLEGEWRGAGFYRFEGRETDERISCRVSNSYDPAAGRLSLTGTCAAAQLKNSMQGYLTKDGDNVTGALLGMLDGARLTKSSSLGLIPSANAEVAANNTIAQAIACLVTRLRET